MEIRKPLLILIAIISFSLVSFLKLLSGLPNAIDTGAHLFRLIYLKKHLQEGIVPLWNVDWYAGAPFLLLYAPLAYYFSSFWPIGDYIFLYKFLEVLFETFLTVSVYFLSKTVLKKRELALLSTFLFVIVPQNIWNFSVVDRFPTLLEAFFFVSSLMFFIKFLSFQKSRDKIISGIFSGLVFLTQGFGYLLMLIILVFFKIIAWKKCKVKDLFVIILISFLVASPWLILSAGSFIYYLQNPYEMVWMVRKFIDVPRMGAILFSLGLPLVACLFLKFNLLKRLRYSIAICLILLSLLVFFVQIPLKYNITKPIISAILILTAIVVITTNRNIYKFNELLKYLFYLTIFLVILSSSLFLYSFTFLSFLDPYRVAFYASIPLAIISAFILQKNRVGLTLSIVAILVVSLTFLSTRYTKMLHIDENLIATLKNSPEEGRLLMIEPELWMHIVPALTNKPSIDGFSPFERFLPYFRNLGFSNNFGLWFEGTTLEQKQEVYNQIFLNVSKFAIKYIIIADNSPIKLSEYLEFETIYNQNGWKILKLKQPISFIENGTLTKISPNELLIYPQGDTLLLKQTYFPGWQTSCGKIKKSVDGLTIIENKNCEKIVLKYNPLSALPQLSFKS
ncbi:MAG: glycosyltransferase family 39 protein [Candidatus Aenigmarchaeota archaeon]|nr:glycosyltransferase family 39 protein [Candidatus Aenigmarchaeota archaeon]